MQSSWIDKVIQACGDVECPSQFIQWSCLAAISATVKRNVWLPRKGKFKTYPNMFVLLVARSGMRKSYGVDVAENIVNQLPGIKTISGMNTIEGIIKTMAEAKSKQSGGIIQNGAAFLLSHEWTNLIKYDDQALMRLTDMYDAQYKDKWTYTTKTAGDFVIEKPCITMLGATTQQSFGDYIDVRDMQGGFVARTIIVTTDRITKFNALVGGEVEPDIDFASLSTYLDELSKLEGPFSWDSTALDLFITWYNKFAPKALDIDDKSNFAARAGDHVLKVAMNLSLARDVKMILLPGDITAAIEMVLGQERKLIVDKPADVKAFDLGPAYKKVLMKLLENPEGITRRRILSDGYGEYDSIRLDRIECSLIESGWLDTFGTGSARSFKLKKHVIDQYKMNKVVLGEK